MNEHGNMPERMSLRLRVVATAAAIASMERIAACNAMAGDERIVTVLNVATGRIFGLYEDQLANNLPEDLASAIKQEWTDDTLNLICVFWFDDDGNPLSSPADGCNTAYLCMIGGISDQEEEEKPSKPASAEGRRFMTPPPANIYLN